MCENCEKKLKIKKTNIMNVKVTVVPTVIGTPGIVVKNLTKLTQELET